MKILLYLLAFVLLLALIFFGRGMLTPTVSYEKSVTVDKSAQEAWAVMSDEATLPKWIKGFKKTEHVSGTPNTVGAVSNVYVEENGQETVMQETITKVTPNELLAMNFSMPFMEMDYEMLLKESNGKTTITTNSVTKGNGLFAKSMISFIQGAMKKQEEENLNSLQKLINENTKDYFPQPEQGMEE